MASKLFTPLKLANVTLEHRIAMAPLTRFRATEDHVLLPFAKEYYAQRASTPGTLLITEGTFIAPEAGGYSNVPGIWNEAHIAAWKEVTAAVHAKQCYISMQLWGLGRSASREVLTKELGPNAKVIGPSDEPCPGGEKPTALTEEEIENYIDLYAQAAKNAIKAGFDAVEIHGANGYLVDQFISDNANKRTDKWGGSVENRCRFPLEIIKAVSDAIGSDRTALRLSPYSPFQEMRMEDPRPTFSYLVRELKKLNIAFLHIVLPRVSGNADVESTDSIDYLIDIWGNQSPLLIAGGFTAELAKQYVEQHANNNIVVVFGRYYIANPDLPFRVKQNIPFTPYDRAKFYNAKDTEGYITYEYSKEYLATNPFQKVQA
ncbi:hypothetical protein F5884DRAFT_802025 [Xylogone sp. PMI_703]|nr:hypothetical protein F5884DRAFT_802025 [Xylogone sp. PMI_703]